MLPETNKYLSKTSIRTALIKIGLYLMLSNR